MGPSDRIRHAEHAEADRAVLAFAVSIISGIGDVHGGFRFVYIHLSFMVQR